MRTLDLHQRIVLLHLETRFVLALLAQQVGHNGLIVRNAHAKRYGDCFAPTVVAGRVVTRLSVVDLLLPGRVDGRNTRAPNRRQRKQRQQQPHCVKSSAGGCCRPPVDGRSAGSRRATVYRSADTERRGHHGFRRIYYYTIDTNRTLRQQIDLPE